MRYEPVRHCIYCGAERYGPGRQRLTDEHIVPFAANGDLILPEAVCGRCQNLTGKPELSVLKFSAKAFRHFHNYRSRSEPPKTLPLKNINGTGETRHVPVDIYPNGFALFTWPKPWLLTGKTSNDSAMTTMWYDMDRLRYCEDGLRKLGIHTYSGVEVSNEMVFRMYAKIAHAFLCAEVGYKNFEPLLLDYIHRRSNEIHHLIGGAEVKEEPTERDYVISWSRVEIGGTEHALVSFRLFARQMGPTILAVAGRL